MSAAPGFTAEGTLSDWIDLAIAGPHRAVTQNTLQPIPGLPYHFPGDPKGRHAGPGFSNRRRLCLAVLIRIFYPLKRKSISVVAGPGHVVGSGSGAEEDSGWGQEE